MRNRPGARKKAAPRDFADRGLLQRRAPGIGRRRRHAVAPGRLGHAAGMRFGRHVRNAERGAGMHHHDLHVCRRIGQRGRDLGPGIAGLRFGCAFEYDRALHVEMAGMMGQPVGDDRGRLAVAGRDGDVQPGKQVGFGGRGDKPLGRVGGDKDRRAMNHRLGKPGARQMLADRLPRRAPAQEMEHPAAVRVAHHVEKLQRGCCGVGGSFRRRQILR